MTDNSGYRSNSPDPVNSGSTGPSRRRGPAKHIGWSAASRLVDGQRGGPGTQELGTLLAVASAPASEATLDPVRLEPVLAAFRAAVPGSAPQRPAQRQAQRQPQPARPSRSAQTLLVKCATVFVLLAGSGVAAASAGVLPASVQRIAHDYFGGVGIPAPSSASSSAADSNPSTTPSTAGSGTASPGSGAASAATTAQLMPLCRQVAANPQNWRSVIDAADQAALVTVAGDPGHVRQYCATLLALPSAGPANASQSATPSPAQSAGPSPTASPVPSATHGNGHGSHSPSPKPHSTGH